MGTFGVRNGAVERRARGTEHCPVTLLHLQLRSGSRASRASCSVALLGYNHWWKKKKKKAQENCPAPRDSRLCYQQVWGSTASQQLSFLLVCLYLTRRAGDRRRLSSVLKLEPVLLGGSDPISLQRIRVWHSQSVVHIGSVSAELFLTTKNISGRVTVCCNHIFPVFLCDNYSHKYHCFTSAQ